MKTELTDSDLINVIKEYYREAESAKLTRVETDKRNMDAYFSKQNWDHKVEGQSKAFIPLTAVSVDITAAFLKKATTDNGDWFDMESITPSVLSSAKLRKFVRHYLEVLDFSTILEDGIKVSSLRSLAAFKVHGKYFEERVPTGVDEEGQLTFNIIKRWKPAIDLLDPSDYFPDPTSRDLYTIHRVVRDISDIQANVRTKENPSGIYEEKVVQLIKEDFREAEKDYLIQRVFTNQDSTDSPGFRKEVVLWEFHGTILNKKGKAVRKNVVCTIANEKYIIRKLQPNPWWHGMSPIVEMPLTRVPFSKWHKALQDDPVTMNLAYNELYNLMADGASTAVHGQKQLREEYLIEPEKYTDGIPINETILVKGSMSPNMKVLEDLSVGNVPQDAVFMLNLLQQHYQVSSNTSDIKQGIIPAKNVKATEIVESIQQSAVGIDAISKRVEKAVSKILKLLALNIFQHLGSNDLLEKDIEVLIGQEALSKLLNKTPQQRYIDFFGSKLKVHGFSSVVSRLKDYQKLIAYREVRNSDPELVADARLRFSPVKEHDLILKMLNIDPTEIERDPEDRKRVEQQIALEQQQNRVDFPGEDDNSGGAPVSAALKGIRRETFTDDSVPAGKGALEGRV